MPCRYMLPSHPNAVAQSMLSCCLMPKFLLSSYLLHSHSLR